MPELPEVEIVKEGLKQCFSDDVTIEQIVFLRKNLRTPLPFNKIKQVLHQPLLSIERRAKYILIEFSKDYIVSHLGMTGTWRTEDSLKAQKIHDHVIIKLKSISDLKKFLIYNDPRRFGVFDVIAKKKLAQDKRFKNLGPEPLSPEFNELYFLNKAKNKRVNIKQFIMDQRIVVGVGNIYASEALFKAEVSPLKVAEDVSLETAKKIVLAIKTILTQAIHSGGSSINDYSNVNSEKGSFQDQHNVYSKKGQPCPKCGQPIFMQVISGRSTFWCVKCQKTPRKKHEKATTANNTRKNSKKITRARRP